MRRLDVDISTIVGCNATATSRELGTAVASVMERSDGSSSGVTEAVSRLRGLGFQTPRSARDEIDR